LAHCAHVILFDNASQDDTLAQAAQRLPHAQLIASPQNLGFGAANNRALAQVRTPFALLLNPDCELGIEHLQQLLDVAAQFPEAAVVAPQLADARGRAEVNYRWPSTHWVSKGPAASGPICVGFLCGAAMLLRLQVCAPVGFFDERFFLYYEDDDLCLRLFQAQLPMLLVPEVQVVHRSRGSVKSGSPWRSEYGRGYHHAQSKLIFAAKHQGLDAARALRTRLVWQTVLALPLRVVVFSPRLIGRMWGRLRGALRWPASAEH
jgi:GT2 family glycosyltransferase